jgi:hypothetical protein
MNDMSGDPIQDLLRQADRTAGRLSGGPADLPRRVLCRVRRRQRIRTGIGAGVPVVVLAVCATLFVTWQGGGGDTTPGGALVHEADGGQEIDRLRADIGRLRAEADAAAALARRMSELRQTHTRLAALKRKLRQPDALEQARREVRRTPFIMVYQADRMCRELGLQASAAEAYRRAIDLFPDSPWAEVARGRLTEIESCKGDLL